MLHITNPTQLSCKYQPGSFWVFKDSLTGKIDTLSVKTLERVTVLMSSYSCDTIENYSVKLSFKNEVVSAFKTWQFNIFQNYQNVTLYNSFVWQPGSQASKVLMSGPNTHMHDTLRLNSVLYKNVGETGAIQFVSEDPNRMESQTLKLFFSPEFGPLQFDLRDRLSGVLQGRRKLISSTIIR